eukprot:TRINITY_DN5439_c0_g1_i1.p1 TRINITY_DN5439_c0_g1~~TRINITY_DN5439_c0_g1_i1.p1  ORF type:complete len:297 (+),score=58.78 TRINITY_DN5439_c0_g1_i1:48-938(+)
MGGNSTKNKSTTTSSTTTSDRERPRSERKRKDVSKDVPKKPKKIVTQVKKEPAIVHRDHFQIGDKAILSMEGSLGKLRVFPRDMLFEIFHYLDISDLVKLSSASKALFQIMSHDRLWKPRYNAMNWYHLLTMENSVAPCCWKSKFLERARSPDEINAVITAKTKAIESEMDLISSEKYDELFKMERDYNTTIKRINDRRRFTRIFVVSSLVIGYWNIELDFLLFGIAIYCILYLLFHVLLDNMTFYNLEQPKTRFQQTMKARKDYWNEILDNKRKQLERLNQKKVQKKRNFWWFWN